VLDGGGEPVRIGFGSLGEGYGVAVSGFLGAPGFPATAGLVYVADAADETVKVYDPGGDPAVPVQVIDGAGTPLLRFNHLSDSDLAVDPADGHVYVVDNLTPGFDEPEAVVHEFSSLGHYRGPVPPQVAGGRPSGVTDAAPSALAISGGRLYLTSGNYFNDNDEPRYNESRVLVFGSVAKLETRILEATKTGTGEGTVFSSSPAGLGCGTACEGEFTLETKVVLNAVPAPRSKFIGWTGCDRVLVGQSPQCEVTMTAARKVSAEFEPAVQRQLTVLKSGDGAGTVASEPAKIDCGVVCEGEFDEDSKVTLIATANQHSTFAGWSGCDPEPVPTRCSVSMSAARSVTAAFAAVADPLPDRSPPPSRPGSLAEDAVGPGPTGPLRLRGLAVHGGSARLQVEVPTAGTLAAFGHGLRAVSALPLAAGRVSLSLHLSASGRRALARARGQKLAIKVALTFAPFSGGASVYARRVVTFRVATGR
jgi:hypothetical protein